MCGAYLDTPNTTKATVRGDHDYCKYAAVGMQGWRCGMEDAHISRAISLPGGDKGVLFGVFDGHGGKEVAEFARDNFSKTLEALPEFKAKNYGKALEKCFMKVDELVQSEEYANDTGTTACVILITKDKIFCSNAGDSRAVLSSGDDVVPLSEDHKPDNNGEIRRIEAAKHFVEDSRVDGNLALSRAFGDFQYKDQKNLKPEQQAVIAFPDLTVRDRKAKDNFILLACDGIWDCLTNDECVKKLHQKLKDLKRNEDIGHVVERVLDDILAPNTEDGIGTDNMTAILI